MKKGIVIAVAVASLALCFQGLGAQGQLGTNVVNASVNVVMEGGNLTFYVTHAPDVNLGETIRVVPFSMQFSSKMDSGSQPVGEADARLVVTRGNGVSVLIPEWHDNGEGSVVAGIHGGMEFSFRTLCPGTSVIGPIPFSRLGSWSPWDGDDSPAVLIRPDIQDDEY